MTALVMPTLIFFAGWVFIIPFFRTPPDDHFANYVSWALFRPPGAKLPSYYSQINQGGFTRMFLYPLAVFVHDWFGRDRLLILLRGITAGLNAAVGSAIYAISVHQLGMANVPAATGAILYLFISTRPQFELLKYNPEMYQVAGEVAGVWILITVWPGIAESWWPIAIPVAWLVFVSLNCKILFSADVAAIVLAVWLMSGFHPIVASAAILGGLTGILLFLLVVPGVSPKSFIALKKYLNNFRQQDIWANFKWNYAQLYTRTPLLAYGVLSGVSLLLGTAMPFYPVFALWSISTAFIVCVQKRFCTYFFLIAFAPMAFLCTAGLNRLYSWHPLLMAAAFAGTCWLGCRSLREFSGYYRKMDARTLVERIHGSMAWLSSHDFRVENVVAHHQVNPGIFMLWQTNLLAHYLTGQPPIVLVNAMLYDGTVMFPERQLMIIDAARKKQPRWLYDFGGAHQGLFNFNPISFLLASGLMFIPKKRRENIIYYELSNTVPPAWSTELEKVQLYVVGSVALDTLNNQLFQAGIDFSLPEFFNRDIADICQDLIRGEDRVTTVLFPDTLIAAPGVAGLYAAAATLQRKDKNEALQMITVWEKANQNLLAVFPALCLAFLALQLLAGRSEDSCRWPEQGFAARTGVHEGFRCLKLAESLLAGDLLSREGGVRLKTIVGDAPAETDIYRYFKINEYNTLLQSFKERPLERADLKPNYALSPEFSGVGGIIA